MFIEVYVIIYNNQNIMVNCKCNGGQFKNNTINILGNSNMFYSCYKFISKYLIPMASGAVYINNTFIRTK